MNISSKTCIIVILPNGEIIDCIREFKKYFPNPIYRKRYDLDKIQPLSCLCAINIEETLEKYNTTFILKLHEPQHLVITKFGI